jgi:poly-gamma-glutamate synthesis protein (capsule biosynthesis protein)
VKSQQKTKTVAAPSDSASSVSSAQVEPARELVLLAGGDVNLGRAVGQRILRGAAGDTFASLAADVASADLTFVNLESPLSEQHGETQSPEHKLVFTGPPGGADLLKAAGIGLVSVANNHLWDYGERGFRETLANLERVGIAAAGASRNPAKLWEPVRLTVRGVRVALFAVTGIWNQGPLERHEARDRVANARDPRLLAAITAERPHVDVLLVSHHGGEEYVGTPAVGVIEQMRSWLRAGADAVLGHHPHVLQGVFFEARKPALASLGNLVFGARSDDPATGLSALARLRFRPGQPATLELCAYYIFGDVPRRFRGRAGAAGAESVRQRVRNLSAGFGRPQLGPVDEHGCFTVAP